MLILDGATGSELTEMAGVDWTSQWSGWPAQLHLPEAVKTVHRSYIEAGADVITANTYCANRHVMGKLCDDGEALAGPDGDVVRASARRQPRLVLTGAVPCQTQVLGPSLPVNLFQSRATRSIVFPICRSAEQISEPFSWLERRLPRRAGGLLLPGA